MCFLLIMATGTSAFTEFGRSALYICLQVPVLVYLPAKAEQELSRAALFPGPPASMSEDLELHARHCYVKSHSVKNCMHHHGVLEGTMLHSGRRHLIFEKAKNIQELQGSGEAYKQHSRRTSAVGVAGSGACSASVSICRRSA